MLVKGVFITIEGPDGAGKTTVTKAIERVLSDTCTVPIVTTREPGGIPIAEQIRNVILSKDNTAMDDRTEALLYAAARRQHLIEKVLPALRDGKLVLSDRFVDSSLAYQGFGREIGMAEIASINQFATEGLQPDLTLFLDVNVEDGLSRIYKERSADSLDRLDQESLSFHERVYNGYQEVVRQNPERITVIDTNQRQIDEVTVACIEVIRDRFPELFI